MTKHDVFKAIKTLKIGRKTYAYSDILELEKQGIGKISRLPYSIRILLESVLRNVDNYQVKPEDVEALARWNPKPGEVNVPFKVARVILQDFTGVPLIVDLAAMRSAAKRWGKDPSRINPQIPCDLVIDHSVQMDFFGTSYAYAKNVELEYERNSERYQLFKWAQKSMDNFRVVPPGMGIVHQVNLECLARVVMQGKKDGKAVLYPDTVLGTDSHTTMINGLGVLGWGVGGIEAEAVMLGQPYYMLAPEVVGMRLTGKLKEGVTATDLVLTATQMLRKHGVVGKFVEYFGPGLKELPLADRATLANMAPEYGATCGFFPVDKETLAYLDLTGRGKLVKTVEAYTKANGMFWEPGAPEPQYSSRLELDLGKVEPSMAGPRRPQDRVTLAEAGPKFFEFLGKPREHAKRAGDMDTMASEGDSLKSEPGPRSPVEECTIESVCDGSVVIASITSCTNTSNPYVMLAAGLLARKAVQAGLKVKPWVKTTLAPGSRAVTQYLEAAGCIPYLEALNFHVAGYGCATCIGNSGPLDPRIVKLVKDKGLAVVSVLSGNRNFEGRINPHVKASYLASPPLVVAYALAGTINVDLSKDPLGYDPNGKAVFLKDLWPSSKEVREAVRAVVRPKDFAASYADVFEGDKHWRALKASTGLLFAWDEGSTYVREVPFFEGGLAMKAPGDIRGAAVLALFGDSITTDHISPAGTIQPESPAGKYLIVHGVAQKDFNSYGSRRGNHEVLMRGTFANLRIRNQLLSGAEGPFTLKFPKGEKMYFYDAAMGYAGEKVPLVIVAGKEYGTGSSRDWAAKGTFLQGVKAVIAESYERIHRSNLIGMGVLPLQFEAGQTAQSIGLTGRERYAVEGIREGLAPGKKLRVTVKNEDGSTKSFNAVCRLDSPVEVDYYKNGGIFNTVLMQLFKN
jgi:aconitate hydratase